MESFTFNGKKYLTRNGYLEIFNDWDEAAARYLAEQEKIELNEHHWSIITYLRDYYAKFDRHPMNKILIKHLMDEKAMERKEATNYLFSLFPLGPAKQAWKIAGLPRPVCCI